MLRNATAFMAAVVLALAWCVPGATPGAAAAPLHLQDRAFLLYALEQDLADAARGELAAERSADEEVRRFARRVADYHRRSGERLGGIARRHGLEPPTEASPLARRGRAALERLSGPGFDREYAAGQVISDYTAEFGARREMRHGFDRELRREGAARVDDLRGHRREAEAIVRRLGPQPAAGLAPIEDRSFLLYAMHADLAQVEFAKITAEQGEDEQVRELARRMIDHHERVYDQWARHAEAHGVEPLRELSSISRRTQDGMRKLAGPPLDRTYLNALAFTSFGEHYRYEREAIHGSVAELRTLAARASEDVKAHHDEALSLMEERSGS